MIAGTKVSYLVSGVRRWGSVLVYVDPSRVLVSQDGTPTTQRMMPAAALTLVASSPPPAPPPAPTPVPVPAPSLVLPPPIATEPYKLVWEDQFAGPLDWTKWHRIWWQPQPTADQVFVKDGRLHLVSHRRDGYPWQGVCTKPYDSMAGTWRPPAGGAIAFEVKFRWTGGKGSWPAFFAFSAANAKHFDGPKPPWTTPCSEYDLFEGHGNPERRPDMQYPGPQYAPWALHEDTSGRILGQDRTQSNWWEHPLPYRLDDNAEHTVLGVWTKTEVATYMDDRLIGRAPTFPSTDQPMFLILEMETGDGGWGHGAIDASTPDRLAVEVESVRVLQKA